MRLAMIDHDGTARCLLCPWDWKVPDHRRKGIRQERRQDRGRAILVLLSKAERLELLQERILAHLRDSHDRLLLTKEDGPAVEDLPGLFQKIYYCGRNPFRR